MFGQPMGRRALGVVAALALVGCGGDSANGDDRGGAPVDLDGNILTVFGSIASPKSGGAGPSTEIDALFTRGDTRFSFQAPGQCTVSESSIIGVDEGFDAGTLSITGAAEPITFAGAGNDRFFRDPKRAAWAPGASLTLKSTGGADAPAFSASAVAPDLLVLSSPDGSATFDVERDRDFVVSWDPISTGGVALSIEGTSAKDARFGTELFCVFRGETGEGSVPAARLAAFASGAGELFGESFNITTASAGAWKIAFGLEQSPSSAAMGSVRLRFR
jgi:hypothetical protein